MNDKISTSVCIFFISLATIIGVAIGYKNGCNEGKKEILLYYCASKGKTYNYLNMKHTCIDNTTIELIDWYKEK